MAIHVKKETRISFRDCSATLFYELGNDGKLVVGIEESLDKTGLAVKEAALDDV